MPYEIISKGNWRFDLLMTSPKRSARFLGLAGNMAEGDIVHILHANVHGRKILIIVISFDLLSRKSWGPYRCSPKPASDLQDSDVSKIIHTQGYLKIMDKSKDKKLASVSLTKFVSGLPYMDWRIIWTLLDKIRNERIMNRLKNPRKMVKKKFPDDMLDVALIRIIRRVNRVINYQLHWGTPIRNDQYLSFTILKNSGSSR